jgi:hypothetical protein
MATVEPNKSALFIWAGPYKTSQPTSCSWPRIKTTERQQRSEQSSQSGALHAALTTYRLPRRRSITFLSASEPAAHGKHHGGEQREGGSGAVADVGEAGVREELL